MKLDHAAKRDVRRSQTLARQGHQRDARLAARRAIVGAANVVARHHWWGSSGHRKAAPYTMRHLQLCVHIVRQWQLVRPELLEQAGFRP